MVKKEIITEQKIINTPAGGVLIGKDKEGQTIIPNDGSLGGFLVGKLHKDGGIKAKNMSNGQAIEVQGNEVVITSPAVADTRKRNLDGKSMTNRQILSKINSDAGGVTFAEGGVLKNGGKLNLINASKKGDHPSRDLNNYNDLMDVQSDGEVGGSNGIDMDGSGGADASGGASSFAVGGEVDFIDNIDRVFAEGGDVGLPIVAYLEVYQATESIKQLNKRVFVNYMEFTEAVEEAYKQIGRDIRTGLTLVAFDADGKSLTRVFTAISNQKNTVKNFNPLTGSSKNLAKSFENSNKYRFKQYDWSYFLESKKLPVSSNTNTTISAQSTAPVLSVANFSGKISDLPDGLRQLAEEEWKLDNANRTIDSDSFVNQFYWYGTKNRHSFWETIQKGDFKPFYKEYPNGYPAITTAPANVNVSANKKPEVLKLAEFFTQTPFFNIKDLDKKIQDLFIERKNYVVLIAETSDNQINNSFRIYFGLDPDNTDRYFYVANDIEYLKEAIFESFDNTKYDWSNFFQTTQNKKATTAPKSNEKTIKTIKQRTDNEKQFLADTDRLAFDEDIMNSIEKDQKDLDLLAELLPSFQESRLSDERATLIKEMKRLNRKITYEGFIKANEQASTATDLFTPQGLLSYYFTQTTQNPTMDLEDPCGLPTPNQSKSKLTLSAYLNVRSSQFKSWFGDWEKAYETDNYINCSKMIDEETKEPKIFYHGVRKFVPNFGSFSNMGQGVVRPYGSFEPPSFPASYFAENEDYAKFYGGISPNMATPSPSYKPFIYKIFLCVKNPVTLLPLGFEVSYKDLIDFLYVAYGIILNANSQLLSKLGGDMDKKHPVWIYIRRDIGLLEVLKDYGYDALIQEGDIPTFDANGQPETDRSKYIKEKEYLTFNPAQVKSATVKKSFYFGFFNDIRFKKGGTIC